MSRPVDPNSTPLLQLNDLAGAPEEAGSKSLRELTTSTGSSQSTLKSISLPSYTVMPATPLIAKKTRSRFGSPVASVMTAPPKKDLFPGKQATAADPMFHEKQAYSFNGNLRCLLQQKSSKDCGGAAFYMVLTDIMRKDPSFKLDEVFEEWMANSYLRTSDEIITEATRLGLQALKKEKLTRETALSIIKDKIENSGLPVLTSITHPIIEGHWIVIDDISDPEKGNVYIRDPHSGGAYCIPSETFPTYLDPDGIEQCISFVK